LRFLTSNRICMNKADHVIDWMLGEGRTTGQDFVGYGEQFCARIVDAGIPISRWFCGVRTLHPLVGATGYIWHRDTGRVSEELASWGDTQSDAFIKNPVFIAAHTGQPYRCRLGTERELEYPILVNLRAAGLTDYLALPMTFSDGTRNPLSFQTDAPGGFEEDDIAALTQIAAVMSLVVEAEARERVARQVLDTYIGRRTGQRVLSGSIQRGMKETILSVVWMSDLRGFTAMTESLPQDAVLDQLNTYFEAVANAVSGQGGEILKFMGDGVLAIFEIPAADSTREKCAAALRAAFAARAAIRKINQGRGTRDKPTINWGLALDIGEVSYGNIGSPDRLDFTVIGSAVNQAARLEALGAQIGETMVISQAVAREVDVPMRDLGTHTIKGIRLPQQAFAPIN